MSVPTEEVCLADAILQESTRRFVLRAIDRSARSRGWRWQWEDVEDAAQEALLRLWRDARTTRPQHLAGYLRQCARNVVSDRIRHECAAKRQKTEEVVLRFEDLVDTGVETPEKRLEIRAELEEKLVRLKGALPPKTLQIVLLVLGAGLTGTEAAAHLGTSVSAVHSMLFRARGRLRAVLGLGLARRRATSGASSDAHS